MADLSNCYQCREERYSKKRGMQLSKIIFTEADISFHNTILKPQLHESVSLCLQ